MIAETVFPSGSKGTETPLDDVQGKNEIMYVSALQNLDCATHAVTITPRFGEQRTLKMSHRPDEQPIPEVHALRHCGLSQSESLIHVPAPTRYHEIMVSSKMSYPTSSTWSEYSLTSQVGCAVG